MITGGLDFFLFWEGIKTREEGFATERPVPFFKYLTVVTSSKNRERSCRIKEKYANFCQDINR